MRGGDERSGSLFSYVDLEARIGKDHPLRTIRGVVNEALAGLSNEFSALYARMGRPSIPPEKLVRAMLLQAFYSIRSERQLMDRLEFDLLFRWFVGIGVDDAAWDHSTFSKNRERLLEGDIAAKLLGAVLAQPRVKRLLSTDHFSVDGTLIEAWASMKSIRPKDGSGEPPAPGGRNREADFHGQKRTNETHASTTDPEARLYRKGPGKEAKLCFMGHALMENRNGLVVDACLTEANGHAERIAALHMIEPRAERPTPITLGADKAYDVEDFVNELRSMNATPHVAQNANGRSSAIDWPHDATLGLCGQPAHPQADRGGLRLDQDDRRPGANQVPRPRARRMGLHLRGRSLQSGAAAEASGGLGVKAPSNCRLIGRWRIVEADIWDRAYLDLSGPATLTITAQGGEIAFGAMEAGLEVEYARDSIGFRWAGCDEGDQVEGEGTAELLDDGTIEIEFAYDNGDEAVLKAKRATSSTAC
jgi:transposase